MNVTYIAAAVMTLAALGWLTGYRRVLTLGNGTRRSMHSIPPYHGAYVALSAALPALLVLIVAIALQGFIVDFAFRQSLSEALTSGGQPMNLLLAEIDNIASGQTFGEPSEEKVAAAERLTRFRTYADWLVTGLTALTAIGGFTIATRRIRPEFRARISVERIIHGVLLACAVLAILITLGIFFSIVGEALRFFGRVPLDEFLFGTSWNPSSAIRADQAVGTGSFGLIPILAGTLMITAIALVVGVPIGLLSAIFLAEYAPRRVRAFGKPIIEILSGIPTVVYGFFAAITVAPFIADTAASMGFTVSYQSALAAGAVMGIMLIPFVSSLSEDVISSVPQSLRSAAYTVGATHGETVRRVVIPAALPGIVGAVILAFSVAVGETMIVLMAAGLFANLTANPFEPVTTMTVQIANILTGDQSFDSATTLSAYALALVLFLITLAANFVALAIVDKYKSGY